MGSADLKKELRRINFFNHYSEYMTRFKQLQSRVKEDQRKAF